MRPPNTAGTKAMAHMGEERVTLIACGILKREISLLIQRNGWPVDAVFLDSRLHADMEALEAALTASLERASGCSVLVLYGYCHPRMAQIVKDYRALRVAGQNCVEMILGSDAFTRELAAGAFFLMEEWAVHWDEIMHRTFDSNDSVLREIFQGDRSCLLCISTPCSGDFREQAARAGSRVGLPVRRREVSLDHLEAALHSALKAVQNGAYRRSTHDPR